MDLDISKKAKKKIKHARFLRNKQKAIMRRRHRYSKEKKKRNLVQQVSLDNKSDKIYNNKIINVLKNNNFNKKVRRKNNEKKVTIDIPEIFSFIKNPDKTVETLKKIFYAGTNKNIKSIYFNYSNCLDLGLCASLVTDLIILALPRYKSKKIHLHGTAPSSREARKLFNITGLPKHLGIIDASTPDTETLDTLSNLESDDMSEKIVDFYQKCLKTQGYELTDLGKNKFSSMIGEVINNCEQYSGKDGTWHALGYFDKPEAKQNYGKCRLVLMNFGHSIYDSLKSKDTTEYTKNQLTSHTKKHYSLFDRFFNEELLWTLYSLQQNVSKKRKCKDDDRGNGTIKLIKSFMDVGASIGEKKSIMSITSGHCHILFDGTYTLKEYTNKYNNRPFFKIAFNKENSLDKKPDENFVYTVQNKFPRNSYFNGIIFR